MKTNERTKAIFRRWPKEGDGIIALFPALAGDGSPANCLSYQRAGQHGTASVALMRDTLPATLKEYSKLAAELRRAGYFLRIVKRFSSADYRARLEQTR